MSTPSSSPVTRAELAAHLEPMRDDIKSIKDGVDVLLLDKAARDAVERERNNRPIKEWSLRSNIAATLVPVIALAALGVSALGLFFH
jgi:hypothetical protein